MIGTREGPAPLSPTLLVRHGETAYEDAERHGRAYDGSRRDLAPLTARGAEQIAALVPRLRKAGPELVVASPYTRTLHSAAILSRLLDCELRVDIELHDWLPAPGRMSTMDSAAVQRAAEAFQTLARGDDIGRVTAETPNEVRDRIHAALLRHRRAGTIVVVTHETLISAALGGADVPIASVHELPS
jgi:broad specificity phosphatase PhoE